MYKRHNGLNQRWTIKYVDTIKDRPTPQKPGDWNIQFNKTFFIKTAMKSGRYAQITGNTQLSVGPKPFDRNNVRMQFWFDPKVNRIRVRDT